MLLCPVRILDMKLVLVESPTKARKLSGYLNQQYTVRASVGHIRDLPKSKMGVDIEHNFEPEYLIPKDKAKVVKELQQLAQHADQIILATDPDREGEAIGWHLQQLLAPKVGAKTSFVRSTFHEITKQAVLEAINNPSELNMALVDAQQARRVLDRLVGYTVSPVLWKKIRYGLSAGRVQSVALRLIVDREREIEAFKPEEYWELDVLLDKNLASASAGEAWKSGKAEDVPQGMIVARLVELNGKTYEPTQASEVIPVVALLDKAEYVTTAIDRKERKRTALPPFTTSTLQQQAATRLGYTSKNTMRLAQQLYEEGLITYHRTDSLNISIQALDAARGHIASTYGQQYLPDKANFFSTKSKNAQEAHEAVRPTTASMSPEKMRESIGAKLTEQHVKLYDLIWRRFLASQMNSAVYDQTTIFVTVSAADQTGKLKANGSVLKFDGWMRLFPNQGDVLLPELTVQQPLQYKDHLDAQKFTQPPPRFNDASLIKTLEQEGIGRPSTYASIISVIEDRGYVERREKKFFPTAIGMAVTDFLQQYFETIVDYKFTANMEDDLDAISRGEKEWRKIIADFYTPLEKKVSEVVETAERAQIPVEKTGEVCPKCGETEHGEVVIRTGRFGKFKSCSRFPACDFTENIVNKVEGVICPLCQEGDVIIKPTRYGRDFYSCTRYPSCDWASWQKPKQGDKVTPEEWKKIQAERAAKKKEREAAGKSGPTKKKTRATKTKKTTKKTAKKPAAKKRTKK
jgi:DNA topoisomerase I